MMTSDELFDLTKHIDATQTECDGSSRLCHLALLRAGIIHQVFVGKVQYGVNFVVPLHYWIQVGSQTIDYRLRMWTDEQAPHGVFRQSAHSRYRYIGKPTSFRLDGCLFLEKIKVLDEKFNR